MHYPLQSDSGSACITDQTNGVGDDGRVSVRLFSENRYSVPFALKGNGSPAPTSAVTINRCAGPEWKLIF